MATKTDFKISLQIGNETYKGSGPNAYEALEKLAVPQKIFLKGVLNISFGDKKAQLLLQPIRIKRLFYSVARLHLAKQLTSLLK